MNSSTMEAVWRAFQGFAAVLLLGFAGCAGETKLTLNPDGSGKATLDITTGIFAMLPQVAGQSDDAASEKAMENACVQILRQFIENGRGFDTWDAPSIKVVRKDVEIKITGYFKNLNETSMTMANFGVPAKLGRSEMKTNENGEKRWVITFAEDIIPAPGEAKPSDPDAESDIRRQAKMLMLTMGTIPMKPEQIPFEMGTTDFYVVGGKILQTDGVKVTEGTESQAEHFTRLRDQLVQFVQMMQDEEVIALWLREMQRQGIGSANMKRQEMSSESLEALKHSKEKYSAWAGATRRIEVAPGEPAFDYAREVAFAREHRNPLMLKLLESQGPASLPPETPVLGVDLGEEDGGVILRTVTPGSPAAAAGLKDGDRLVAVDLKAVSKTAEAQEIIRSHKPGDKLSCTIQRGAEKLQVEVEVTTLGAMRKTP